MISTIRFLYVLLFIALASQGIFYFLAVGKALQLISLDAFIEQRKLIDGMIKIPLNILYCSSILLGVALLLLQIKHYNFVVFITVALSLAFLFADVYFAVTKSIPLNALIRDYHFASNQLTYETIRIEWLYYIKVRGAITICGLLILLAGFIANSNPIEK